MKKKLSILVFSLFVGFSSNAQELSVVPKNILYYPGDDAALMISEAAARAKKENKHVFISVGDNWCKWCIRFDNFIHSDPKIDSLVKADFIVYHLNYSPENENKDILARYGYPQRFGFPVFLILDGDGNRLHTQNSEYLESGNTYSATKVQDMLMYWNRRAVDPQSYKQP